MSEEATGGGLQLYQLLGAALRDIAQARFTSDLYSRQISFVYEADSLLRRFPVPRTEIDEVELTLHFAVKDVSIDPQRHNSRNAAIGSLFDQYSAAIVRDDFSALRKALPGQSEQSGLSDVQQAAIADFSARFLGDENLDRLRGRLLQYFNESAEDVVKVDGSLDVKRVSDKFGQDASLDVMRQAAVESLKGQLPQMPWQQLTEQSQQSLQAQLKNLDADVQRLRGRYPDFKLEVEVGTAALAAAGSAVSSVRVKSAVRNYTWSKVDVDSADFRHVRTLSPE